MFLLTGNCSGRPAAIWPPLFQARFFAGGFVSVGQQIQNFSFARNPIPHS